MQKRGISPLIATMLIIGFVIILAALVFTWGSDILNKTKESSKRGEIDLECLNKINPSFIKACSDGDKINMLIDNKAEQGISSFLFRVKGNSGTETIKQDLAVKEFETKSYNLPFRTYKVGIADKVEAIPYITVDGEEWSCDVKKIEKNLDGCACESEQTKNCGLNVGVCLPGTISCVDKKWGACIGAKNPDDSEICGDELDNDCDNSVDEECSCSGQTTRTCGIDRYPCVVGFQYCINNIWGECGGSFVGPETEECTPLTEPPSTPIDEDCDSLIDEDCDCLPGEEGTSRECYTGSIETKNVGICKSGTQTCTGGKWGYCENEKTPKTEVCGNGIDENCDGNSDNSCSCLTMEFMKERIKNVKVNFFNQKINFDFDNTNNFIGILKFKVGVTTKDTQEVSEETKGVNPNFYAKNIQAPFDLIAIGFDNIEKVEIIPYIGIEYCDIQYTNNQIEYYDPDGKIIDEVWKVWDDGESIWYGGDWWATAITEDKFSGEKSLRIDKNGLGITITPMDSISGLDQVDSFIFAYKGKGGVYNAFKISTNDGDYYLGSHSCCYRTAEHPDWKPFICAQPGGWSGGWYTSILATGSTSWALIKVDLDKITTVPSDYICNVKCPSSPTPCAIAPKPNKLNGIYFWKSFTGTAYFDNLYFYSIKK